MDCHGPGDTAGCVMQGLALAVVLLAAVDPTKAHGPPQRNIYSASVVHFDGKPVVSFVDGSADFAQVFNPSWVVGSPGTNGKAGLLIRTQNCSSQVGGSCTHCNFAPCQNMNKPCPPGVWTNHQCQDVITFAELLNNDNQVG